MQLRIGVVAGPGEEYAAIHVIRIALSATGNDPSPHGAAGLPEVLDVRDYDAVLRYVRAVHGEHRAGGDQR